MTIPTHRHDLANALLELDRVAVQRILQRASPNPAAAIAELEQPVVEALQEIGEAWERGDLSLSQVYMSARLCEELMGESAPPLANARPRVALAVLEDHHLLGKRMVLSILRSAGVAVLDYGSVGVADLAARAVRDGVEVVLVSALMLRSALKVKELIERLGGTARSVRVAVGGAPFRLDTELWREVGADAVGLSAAEAPAIVARLLQAREPAEASR